MVLTFEHVMSGCVYDCKLGLKAYCSHCKGLLLISALTSGYSMYMKNVEGVMVSFCSF